MANEVEVNIEFEIKTERVFWEEEKLNSQSAGASQDDNWKEKQPQKKISPQADWVALIDL